jgi:hypothetical protein
MNNVIQIMSDGTLNEDVYMLVGPFALSNTARTRADLLKFLKLTKGHQGTIRLFADREQQTEITDDNYASIAPTLVGKDIYFTVEE